MAKRKQSEIAMEESITAEDQHSFAHTHKEEEQQSEVIRVLRDVRPAHYLFKIKNFSSLISAEVHRYESSDFLASGFMWKLCLYPEGVKRDNKHISLYLVLSKSNSLPMHKEVNVCFKLFVYDQILDKYLTIQDGTAKTSCFRGTKTQFGFDQLLPLSVFSDRSGGYLVDDCCIFGAEIFVVDPISKGECVTVVNNRHRSNETYTWNFQNFAERKQQQEYFKSPVFLIAGYKWSLTLFPNGNTKGRGQSLSLFLYLEEALVRGHALTIEFGLCVKDQLNGGAHWEGTGESRYFQFSDTKRHCGFSDLIPLGVLNDTTQGYLVDGDIILEVEISVITKVEEFS
ncbi:TRAF-like family protein [Euphorbia peplus]|nr:TRAF-like family protein [Euphorbia peplus]